MRYVKTPDIESVLIDYHYIGNDWLFIKDKEMTINLDGGKNIKLKSHESDTNVGVGFRNGVEEIGFYQITKKQLKQICDAKEVEVLIQASKGRHYLKNEETKGCTGGMTPSVNFCLCVEHFILVFMKMIHIVSIWKLLFLLVLKMKSKFIRMLHSNRCIRKL